MRISWTFLCLVAIMLGNSAHAQQTKIILDAKCEPIKNRLANISATTASLLFTKLRTGWTLVPQVQVGGGFFYQPSPQPFHVRNPNNVPMQFIYVPAPAKYDQLQYLAIKTTVWTNSENEDLEALKVALRKQRFPAPRSVFFKTYQGYHQNNARNEDLRIYHYWDDQNRSDSPRETRKSFAFNAVDGGEKLPAYRHLLTISFRTSVSKLSCVPFTLGAQAQFVSTDDGDEEVSLQTPLIIQITEAKTGTGGPGASFVVDNGPWEPAR